jgi:hypothetical protein
VKKEWKRETQTARYYNCGHDGAVAIVAVLTYFDDELFDWAAYIGACADTSKESIAVKRVSEYGCKLYTRDAEHYFPDLPVERYRP